MKTLAIMEVAGNERRMREKGGNDNNNNQNGKKERHEAQGRGSSVASTLPAHKAPLAAKQPIVFDVNDISEGWFEWVFYGSRQLGFHVAWEGNVHVNAFIFCMYTYALVSSLYFSLVHTLVHPYTPHLYLLLFTLILLTCTYPCSLLYASLKLNLVHPYTPHLYLLLFTLILLTYAHYSFCSSAFALCIHIFMIMLGA